MKYICAQPASNYYRWQVEVLINNFIKNGVEPSQMHILCSTNGGHIPDDWIKLKKHYAPVGFYFYEDTRGPNSYSPSVYFNLMKHHLTNFPQLKDEYLFLHDSDIVFTRPPEVDWHRKPNTWYMSDTNSYINYDYIQQKGNELYENMCNIVGIDKQIPKLLNNHSGGAQYIVIGEGAEFWDKVEKDSIYLYDYFCAAESSYVKTLENEYPIQKWTAGMWALLWNAWLFGHPTEVDSRLSFGWSTDDINVIEKHWILHNAGVTNSNSRLFFKSAYTNKLPYNEDLDIDQNRASYYYWTQVQETAKKTILK